MGRLDVFDLEVADGSCHVEEHCRLDVIGGQLADVDDVDVAFFGNGHVHRS